MTKSITLRLLAVAIGACGLMMAIFALVSDDVPPFLRATTVASGTPLVVAAVLLFRERKLALPLLWLSTLVYFLSIVVPSIQRHGDFRFSNLIDAFYWSLVTRMVVTILAHRLLRVAKSGTGHRVRHRA